MNTKIITFCVFATLFMGAYVALCSIGLSGNACAALWLSILFVTAAILCAIVDFCKSFFMSRYCWKSIADLEAMIASKNKQIEELKKSVEAKQVLPVQASAEDIKKHNDELQELLDKLKVFGDALNQVKKELNEITKLLKNN